MPCLAFRARQVLPDRLANSPWRRARQRDGDADAVRPPDRATVRVRRWRRGTAAGTGASARRQTLRNLPIAVTQVRTSMIHNTGTRNTGERKPKPSRIIRSARSINPPLAEMPSDSAFARWYDTKVVAAN